MARIVQDHRRATVIQLPAEINHDATFVSNGLGELRCTEENLLAAVAYDRMGWPMSIMTGAELDDGADSSCGLSVRQMAGIKYDPNTHVPRKK